MVTTSVLAWIILSAMLTYTISYSYRLYTQDMSDMSSNVLKSPYDATQDVTDVPDVTRRNSTVQKLTCHTSLTNAHDYRSNGFSVIKNIQSKSSKHPLKSLYNNRILCIAVFLEAVNNCCVV